MEYYRRSTTVKAMELTRRTADMVVEFIGETNMKDHNLGEFAEDGCFIEVCTPKGVIALDEGDFVVEDFDGKFYVYSAEDFNVVFGQLSTG